MNVDKLLAERRAQHAKQFGYDESQHPRAEDGKWTAGAHEGAAKVHQNASWHHANLAHRAQQGPSNPDLVRRQNTAAVNHQAAANLHQAAAAVASGEHANAASDRTAGYGTGGRPQRGDVPGHVQVKGFPIPRK